MFSAAATAQFLDEAHRTRAPYRNLPEPIAPGSFAEAYSAQEALCRLWEPRLGPVAARKIAVTTKVMQELMGIEHPCVGAVFASRVHRSPARIAKADFINVRVECELAVRIGRSLPKGPAPYTRASVRPAVSQIMADTVEGLRLSFPPPSVDLAAIRRKYHAALKEEKVGKSKS